MVLLEAMAAGTAVVASDIDGYRQAAGGHAVLVPPPMSLPWPPPCRPSCRAGSR